MNHLLITYIAPNKVTIINIQIKNNKIHLISNNLSTQNSNFKPQNKISLNFLHMIKTNKNNLLQILHYNHKRISQIVKEEINNNINNFNKHQLYFRNLSINHRCLIHLWGLFRRTLYYWIWPIKLSRWEITSQNVIKTQMGELIVFFNLG